MKRIYHPYYRWEDYKAGFYNNLSGINKQEKIEKVIELFSDEKLTKEYMNRVINEWVYSCEHNLSNPSINKIAYIGQGACCLYAGVPNLVTMAAWKKIDLKNRIKSDKIASNILSLWIQNQKLKNTYQNGKVKDTQTEYQMKLHLS